MIIRPSAGVNVKPTNESDQPMGRKTREAAPPACPAPMTHAVDGAKAGEGWLPPGGYRVANAWARANRAALEFYAAEIERYGTASSQLEVFLHETESSRNRGTP